MECKMIFVTNDGQQHEGKDNISKVENLFPINTVDIMEPIFFSERNKPQIGFNKTIIYVYQNGTYEIMENIPPNPPFNAHI